MHSAKAGSLAVPQAACQCVQIYHHAKCDDGVQIAFQHQKRAQEEFTCGLLRTAVTNKALIHMPQKKPMPPRPSTSANMRLV